MSKSIRHNFFFPNPAAMVWEYLTKSELIAEWLMPNNFQLIDGHEFQFRINPMDKMNFDGISYCKILEIIPLKKLSYSWKGGPGNGMITLDTIVVWTLVPKEGGTELQLVHSGFNDDENAMAYTIMNHGWLVNIKEINDLINADKS